MYKKLQGLIYLFVLALIFCTLTHAQYPSMETTAFAFQESLKSIGVKGAANFLPFTDLDKNPLILINKSSISDQTITSCINRYSLVQQVSQLNNSFDQMNIILIGNHFSLNEIDLINALGLNNKVILLTESDIKLNDAGVIHLALLDELSLDQSIQIIFGALSKGAIRKMNGRLSFVPAALAGFQSQALKDSIMSITLEGMNAAAYPGATILVAKDGMICYLKSFGHHDYSLQRKVQTDDLYDLASITKVAGATTALMKLKSQNKFNHKDSLGRYLPYFNSSNKGQMIFTDILTHQAQLKAWIPYWRTTLDENNNYLPRTFQQYNSESYPIQLTQDLHLHKDYKKEIYKAIAESPLRNKREYLYSGLVFYLIPELIKRQSGLSFQEYLTEEVYKPLGANSFCFNAKKSHRLERIIPTEHDTFFRKIKIHGEVHDEGSAMMNGLSGNAGLFSNAEDLAKLMQMLLQDGVYGNVRILAKGISKEYTRCHFCHEDNKRGLGFDKPLIEYDEEKSGVAQSASPSSFGHTGYTGTMVWADPESDLIYIFFSNRVLPTRENRKLYTMNIRPRMHQAIYDAIKN